MSRIYGIVVSPMYVQYFLPANEKAAYPFLMWHGVGPLIRT